MEEFKENIENIKKAIFDLIEDQHYIEKITPKTDNSASETDNDSWRKEISISVKSYPLYKFLTF